MIRMRRLRVNDAMRNLVRETTISKNDLVYPVFVTEGENVKNPVDSMPGIYQYSIDRFDEELDRIVKSGIPAILISAGHCRCVSLRIYLTRTLRSGMRT